VIQFYRLLYGLLDRPTKRRLGLAVAAMVALAVLEGLALLALVPLLQILSAPDLQSDSNVVSTISDFLGNPTPSNLAIVLGVFALSLYLVKAVVAIVVMRFVPRRVAGRR